MDVLVHDKIVSVRRGVAIFGRDKDLDILVHDKAISVRQSVAKHGRPKDLEILIKDDHVSVSYPAHIRYWKQQDDY
ncbi:hypothetical protein [Lactobacillus delbrueckii]|uniref:hypothetical protein n=1 Tax=Lactobacillus delbrueckii TaxID=1584 RepID=UPI0022EBADB4|nr:hypothetical protein [Lactobacillus delbrueckii]MDA3796709.1 hypothetical protein [Lactobacillus delbrueckii]